MDERMRKLNEQARLEAEKMQAEYDQQMKALNIQLARARPSDKADLLREIEELQASKKTTSGGLLRTIGNILGGIL